MSIERVSSNTFFINIDEIIKKHDDFIGNKDQYFHSAVISNISDKKIINV